MLREGEVEDTFLAVARTDSNEHKTVVVAPSKPDAKTPERALRYNVGKLRVDLVPTSAVEGLAKVLGFGAEKYGPDNWKKGLPWMECTASMERHLLQFKRGEDFDPESGLLHLEHLITNAAFLIEYYRTHPEFDDRPRARTQCIGLDIDDVLADFVSAYRKRFGIERNVESWNFDENMKENMKILNGERDFWLSLEPKVNPSEIPFEPHCYITARSIPVEWTLEWLKKHNFPVRPVHSVGYATSKSKAVKESGCTWFVDDGYHNFEDINRAGVCCFLFDSPQNRRYDVGARRIKSLKELK